MNNNPILDLCPEESLLLCGALAVAVYRCYSTAELIVISEFLEALSLNIKLLNSKKEYMELLKVRCEVAKVDRELDEENEDEKDEEAEIEALKEKLKAIGDLVLKVT